MLIPIFIRRLFDKKEDEIEKHFKSVKVRYGHYMELVNQERELERRLTKEQLQKLDKELNEFPLYFSGREEFIEHKLSVARQLFGEKLEEV